MKLQDLEAILSKQGKKDDALLGLLLPAFRLSLRKGKGKGKGKAKKSAKRRNLDEKYGFGGKKPLGDGQWPRDFKTSEEEGEAERQGFGG